MTEVKICGIRNLEDAVVACECGADAVGFIFYKGSPRCVLPEEARRIIVRLPRGVAKVGVFVHEDLAVVRSLFEYCRLDYIQVHGNETLDYCRGLPSRALIKAVHLRTPTDLAGFDDWAPRAFLVDTMDPVGYGGTGRLSDWGLAGEAARRYPILLAGGLKPDNVGAAIARVSPAGVDVGSGVEKAPGKKDHEKIRAFINAVRAADGGGCARIFKTTQGSRGEELNRKDAEDARKNAKHW